MRTFEMSDDEVILYQGYVYCDDETENLTLTSKKIVFEKEEKVKTGFMKNEKNTILVDQLILENIKQFNGNYLVNQKGSTVSIQSVNKDYSIIFEDMLKAKVFVTKVMDALTAKSLSQRGVDKVKGAIDTVDDILGFDTRQTLKGTIEHGININIGGISFGKKKNKKNKK